MVACVYTPSFLDNDRVYQICTCGQHVWSSRSKRVIYIKDKDSIRTTMNGKVVVIPIHREKRRVALWAYCLLYMVLVIAILCGYKYIFLFNN
jgi:hypothetical protein